MLYPRTLIQKIQPYLTTEDIIVLHGARQVGKTHILYYLKEQFDQAQKSTHYIDLEDSRYVHILNQGVEHFLEYLEEEGHAIDQLKKRHGTLTVFIDEIQYLDNPSPFLKLLADHHHYIKLIVSGSSSFHIKSKFSDSLVGRTVDFEVHPLSFEELLVFKNKKTDFSRVVTQKKQKELQALVREYVLYGGYPKVVLTKNREQKEKYIQQIIDTYVRKDIRDLGKIKNIDKFNRLLEVLAGQSGQLLNVAELASTIGMAKQSIEEYLFLLEETYIIALVRPWYKNIRSELFKRPKVFFYDTGLMQLLWLKTLQREVLGNVFETALFSELTKTVGRSNIYFWRTTDKKEVDFIIRRPMDTIIAIEAKMNFTKSAQRSLRYFAEHYHPKQVFSVGLLGQKKNPQSLFLWELQQRVMV